MCIVCVLYIFTPGSTTLLQLSLPRESDQKCLLEIGKTTRNFCRFSNNEFPTDISGRFFHGHSTAIELLYLATVFGHAVFVLYFPCVCVCVCVCAGAGAYRCAY